MTPSLASLIPDLTPVLPGLVFWVLAGLSVVSAVAAAMAPKIVHAAFGLMAAFFGVAGLYALLGADFLSLTQVVVYVGGILVLLVFGVLLTGRAKAQLGLEKPVRVGGAVAAGTALLLGLLLAIGKSDLSRSPWLSDLPEPQGTTHAIGRALLDPEQYLLPFELVSVFLLAALVGAAYLVRRRRDAS
ncbi:MAG: NADH-quinone oxidoreductase subunit J [Planctomycetes bacterium]|nr:NADH-quinone oxidoreductase subunit J [Planctomycetota bacterium]